MKRERVQNRKRKEWEAYWREGGRGRQKEMEREGGVRRKEIEHKIEIEKKGRVMGVMRGGIWR